MSSTCETYADFVTTVMQFYLKALFSDNWFYWSKASWNFLYNLHRIQLGRKSKRLKMQAVEKCNRSEWQKVENASGWNWNRLKWHGLKLHRLKLLWMKWHVTSWNVSSQNFFTFFSVCQFWYWFRQKNSTRAFLTECGADANEGVRDKFNVNKMINYLTSSSKVECWPILVK